MLENGHFHRLSPAPRAAIVARVGKLRTMPGLDDEERQAITDVLAGLRNLEQERANYDAEEKRRILEHRAQRLRSVAPAILKPKQDPE
jgi:hypothetical protein